MQDRMPFIISLPMAGALVFLGYRFGLMRLYVIAALMVMAGYVYSMLPITASSETTAFGPMSEPSPTDAPAMTTANNASTGRIRMIHHFPLAPFLTRARNAHARR